MRELLAPILEMEQFELVDVEYKAERAGWVLRIFIDRQGGITVDDCAFVSNKIQDLIDIKIPIPHRYLLEVSSPGLDRPLRTKEHFQRFLGHRAKIRTKEPKEGRKNFTGRIVACEDDVLSFEDEQGRLVHLALSSIDKAKLIVEL